MITTNDLKNGMAINYEDSLFEVIYFPACKTGERRGICKDKIKKS